MPIPITCTSCGYSGQAPDGARSVRCPTCRAKMQVPSAEETVAIDDIDWPVEAKPSTWTPPPVPEAIMKSIMKPRRPDPPPPEPEAVKPRRPAPPPPDSGRQRACPFCAENILADAIKCRFCGSKVKQETWPLAVIACLICLVLCLGIFGGSQDGVREVNPNTRVIHAARYAVRQNLAPKPVKFPLPEEYGAYQVTNLGGDRFKVSGSVDTVNAFNTPTRLRWTVILDGSNYVIESIE